MAETSEVEYHTLTTPFARTPIRLNSSITSPKAVARVVRKYQIHTKTYSPKWELDPNYRGWVQRSQRGDGFFYCLACSKNYTCGKSELDKHASSKKHCINLKTMIASASQLEATQIVKTDDSESVESMFLDDMNSSSTSFVDEVSWLSFDTWKPSVALQGWKCEFCYHTNAKNESKFEYQNLQGWRIQKWNGRKMRLCCIWCQCHWLSLFI